MKKTIPLITILAFFVGCSNKPVVTPPLPVMPPSSYVTDVLDYWDFRGVSVKDVHGALSEMGVRSGLSRNFSTNVNLNTVVYTSYNLIASDASLYNGCDSSMYSQFSPKVDVEMSVRRLKTGDVRLLITSSYSLKSFNKEDRRLYPCYSSGLLEALIIGDVWYHIHMLYKQKRKPEKTGRTNLRPFLQV